MSLSCSSVLDWERSPPHLSRGSRPEGRVLLKRKGLEQKQVKLGEALIKVNQTGSNQIKPSTRTRRDAEYGTNRTNKTNGFGCYRVLTVRTSPSQSNQRGGKRGTGRCLRSGSVQPSPTQSNHPRDLLDSEAMATFLGYPTHILLWMWILHQ